MSDKKLYPDDAATMQAMLIAALRRLLFVLIEGTNQADLD